MTHPVPRAAADADAVEAALSLARFARYVVCAEAATLTRRSRETHNASRIRCERSQSENAALTYNNACG